VRIKALVPWFGSKRRLAPEIVRELGPHAAYWEPFCGSLAVLLAKPPCPMETVNDLHADLVNLANAIADHKSKQMAALLGHELCHCDVARDKHGEAKEDERGRPIWRIRRHDIEEFDDVVDRHGCWESEIEHFAKLALEDKGAPLFDAIEGDAHRMMRKCRRNGFVRTAFLWHAQRCAQHATRCCESTS